MPAPCAWEKAVIEASELPGGVWLFRGDKAGRNFAVMISEGRALLVDPGLPSAIERFLGDMGAQAVGVAYTGGITVSTGGLEGAIEDAWAGIPAFHPESLREPILLEPLPGWRLVPLGAGPQSRPQSHMAVFQDKARVLLCGDLLPEPSVGVPDLDGGSEAYLEALQKIEALDPKLVVPWRGEPASGKRAITARIENDRSYVNSLVRHVATSSVAGVPLDRLIEVAATLYDDFPHLEAHLENMRVVWQELRGT